MTAQELVQQTLQNHYQLIKERNPSYSIRAFAKRVGVAPGTLSLVLNGKRKVSPKLVNKIADNLGLDPIERSEILKGFQEKKITNKSSYTKLANDQFNILGEWHHFAILNLIKTKSFQSDVNFIAERLGLSSTKVEKALERLERLGLIAKDNYGIITRTNEKLRTEDDVANMALRKSHFETLELANRSLEKDDVNDRDFTWLTFAFDVNKMKKAKEIIRRFQDEFLEVAREDSTDDEVYRLAVQFFPLSNLKKNKKPSLAPIKMTNEIIH